MSKQETNEIAKVNTQRELQALGFLVSRNEDGNLEASKDGTRLRIRVCGLQQKNAVFLTKQDLMFTDAVVIYQIDKKYVWIFTKAEARELLDAYQSEPIKKGGKPRGAEGFNVSQFPSPMRWERFLELIN